MSDPRRAKLEAFRAWAGAHITGDEKGQAQIFLDRLMQAFGHACQTGEAPLTDAVHGAQVVRILSAIDRSCRAGGAPETLTWA